MGTAKDRLELCVTYVARDVTLGVKRSSIEFVDRKGGPEETAITVEGHVKLEPGVSFYVNKADFCLGRSVNNDLFVDSPKISRSHAKIIAGADASYELRDLGSANGTSVSGRKLEHNEACKLRDSGEIQLAGVFHLKFSDYGATHVAPDSKTIYGITLSHADRRISLHGAAADDEIKLSNSEYRFLQLLMDFYPEPVSHRDLAYAIWGWEPTNADDDKRVRDALFNIVKRLRERLELLDPDHEYIETVRKWGEREGGYRFNKQ
jgi:DNA-binding winged helix-turn-helix (wHTH) protein